MKALAEHITKEFETANHCAVYETDLMRAWPVPDELRQMKIAQFAQLHGWQLSFYKEGLCAIFTKKGREAMSE